MKRRLDLTFPPRQAKKPVAYHLVRDFDLVPNILRAQIHPGQEGRMVVEVTGKKEDIEAAIEFLVAEGLQVRPAASDIALDTEACVVCGLCTAVCRTGAMVLRDAELVLDKDKCVYCEACVSACPRRAVTMEF